MRQNTTYSEIEGSVHNINRVNLGTAITLMLIVSVCLVGTSGTVNAATINTNYRYDSLNRLTNVSYSGTENIAYTYDAAGNITLIAKPGGPPVDGVCGGSNNAPFTAAPTSDLCTKAAASAVSGSGPWNWTCGASNYGIAATCSASLQTWTVSTTVTGGNGTVTCTSPVNHSAPSTCTVTPSADYQLVTFTDNSIDKKSSVIGSGYSISNVTANHTIEATFAGIPVNAACGSSSGGIFTDVPTTNLCSPTANVTLYPTNFGWNWNCSGSYGGSSAACSAYSSATSQPVTLVSQNFDGVTAPALPAGWTSTTNTSGSGTSGKWQTHNGTAYPPGRLAHSLDNLIYFNSSAAGTGRTAYLSSPVFSLAGTIERKVNFWMFHDSVYSNVDQINVYANTTSNLTGASLLGTVSRYKAVEGWAQYTFDIPGTFSGSTNYLLINGVSAYGSDIHLDDIAVDAFTNNSLQTITVTTPAPLTAANKSQFTVAATASSGLTVTYSSGSTTICTNNGGIFTMIAPSGTCVVRYGQAGNASYAAAPEITNNTTATPFPQVTLMTQNFDSVTVPALPVGWTTTATGTGTWQTNSGTHYPSGYAAHTPNNLVYFNSCSVGSGVTAFLSSPAFSLTGTAGGKISFWMYHDTGYTYPDLVNVYVNSASSLTGASLIGTVNRYNGTAGWSLHSFDIPGTFTGATNYLLINGVSAFGNDIHLDDFSVIGNVPIKDSQSITVTTAAPLKAPINSQFTVAATASSGLPVTYSSGSIGICTNNGAAFTVIATTGTCIVRYNQAGNVFYAAAPQVASNTSVTIFTQITVTLAGTGSVTSNPAGIDCTSGSATGCMASFPINSPVTLNTLPAWYFGVEWTGCAANGNSCGVSMDADKSVIATFGPAHNAQILTKTGYYGKLADAYTASNPSGIIQARDAGFVVFVENPLLFDKEYTVTLEGGKNSVWGNSGGYTAIKGPLKIQKGKVTVQGVKIQ